MTLYSFFRLFGHAHLVFVKGLLGLALFGLCWRLSYRQSAKLFATVLVALAAMAAANYRFYLRPELLGLLFFVIVLSLLAEFRAGGKRHYLLAYVPPHNFYILLLQRDFDMGIRRMPDLQKDGWRIVFADGKVVLLGRPLQAARLALHRLRQWDARSATGVDLPISNSSHIARRIRKACRREP